MAVDLKKLLDLGDITADEEAMLDDLQANILKGHGRDYTVNIFLHFEADRIDEVKGYLRRTGQLLTPASQQLDEAQVFKATGTPGEPVSCFFLSHSGYLVLNIDKAKIPTDGKFVAGMKKSNTDLADPSPEQWDEPFQQDADDTAIHAMMLLADDDPDRVQAWARSRVALMEAKGISILGVEHGQAIRNVEGRGIEQFGYVDGRSQPLFIQQDVDEEKKTDPKKGFIWDPAFKLDRVLVPDPGGSSDRSHGSYFIFRKLEENVKGFKDKEGELAKALGLKGEAKERAGAMVVGRFEDGTPVVRHDEPVDDDVENNDFDFTGDPNGLKCPFRGHIRKTNPRGESVGPRVTLEQERAHIMARRGITYGERTFDPVTGEPSDEPEGDVGLLFMAYNVDVANQFEFTQRLWVNNLEFLKPNTGLDPVLGQGASGSPDHHKWVDGWGDTTKVATLDFHGYVTLKGGEYFFAPSRSFFASL
jgi:Dyp-type peroxidase family